MTDSARTAERRTRSGIPLQDYYTPHDVAGLEDTLAQRPGQFPYMRGRRPTPTHGWIQRSLSGEGGPERSNEQLRFLISGGQTGVSVISDAPSMALLDPDHPLARNAIGTQGVSLCCKRDYLELYRDIPLDQITISASQVFPLFQLAGLYLAAREYGFAIDKLRGSVMGIPLYPEDCSYALHLPVTQRVRAQCDAIEWCARTMPRFHSCIEDTYFFSESGLNAVEEMALGFVEIRHLVRKLIARGVPVDSFAPRIAILVNCSMDFFEEIAKLRATRRLFARMMKEEFGAQDPRSHSVLITSHTSGLTLTAQQPVNNIMRGTLQALALVLGGAHAIEISTFDEAFRTPSPQAQLVGLRTQQILELESGVANVVDPLAGSYYVEHLTAQMERRIWQMIQDIEARGDPEQLCEQGFFRAFFTNCMERYHRAVEENRQWVVGVNVHRLEPEQDTLLREIAEAKIHPALERIEQIRTLRQDRDLEVVRQRLRAVRDGAAASDNLVPLVIEAFDANATMGEIAGALRQASGYPWDPFGLVAPLI